MRIKVTTLLLIMLGMELNALAQVAQSGYPMQPVILKSRQIPSVNLPSVDNDKLLEASFERYREVEVLKPFQFAHTFNVNLNPANSGSWVNDADGYNIWQLEVKSKGAYSLNLILQPFRLPPGARLFVYNKGMSHVIGAFTDLNNKPFHSLALSPVRGDEIVIQYEEPAHPEFKGELTIKKINHDFVGILADENGRRPLGISGDCNIDINCELAKDWKEIKNSVCRIIVEGTEICTGALINNTSEDKTPYILTANHCFSDYINGEHNTVFLFNYESPYCGSLDGDITNSVSGSLKVAESDSLDFSLVELTLLPLPEYRPFYAGWDRSASIPDSTASIHQPLGDIKKIALDYNSPVIASFGSNKNYLKNGFWKTLRWDYGTTQAGSSGGPYFDQDFRIIGTLTGGAATCSNPVNDYFERFDFAWDHYPDSSKQLKYWLDPDNTGVDKTDGIHGYEDENFCDAFTNLVEGDSPALTPMYNNLNEPVGYWAGTNSNGGTEFVEKFSIPGNEDLRGISLGVGQLVKSTPGTGSFISVNVYNSPLADENLIYSQDVDINDFVADAMNFIGFDETVQPSDTFFVGFDVSNIHESATFAVYQAVRDEGANSLFYKQNGEWFDYSQEMSPHAAALAFELIACNVDYTVNDTPHVDSAGFIIYPNPSGSEAYIRSLGEIGQKDIAIFDLLGHRIDFYFEELESNLILVDLSGNSTGIYYIRIENMDGSITQKFIYQPY